MTSSLTEARAWASELELLDERDWCQFELCREAQALVVVVGPKVPPRHSRSCHSQQVHTRSVPDLARVIEFITADARHGRFVQWGTSTVVDENTGEPVIDRPLFDALHAAAGIDAEYPIGNAGVIHVYGYWFSTALTPYGYKRDRWQNGELAAALGEPSAAFRLTGDAESTPLQRITAATLPLLQEPPANAASAEVRVGDSDTRVVLTSHSPSASWALIYGIRSDHAGWRMITTFPLAGDTDAVIADFMNDRRLRWNAALSPNL